MPHLGDRTVRDPRLTILVSVAIMILVSPYIYRYAQNLQLRPQLPYHLVISNNDTLGMATDDGIPDDHVAMATSPYLLPFLYKKLPVNEVDEVLLQTVPGIGPSLARRIIEDRRENGVYTTLNDLTRVDGIGLKRAKYLQLYLSCSTVEDHSD